MGEEKKEEKDTPTQVEEGAEEDLNLNDEDANKVVGGVRKAGGDPVD